MKSFMTPYPWTEYSNLLKERILNPLNVGFFKPRPHEKVEEMRIVIGENMDQEEENHMLLFLVVDVTDGIIADAKFQAWGHSCLIGTADIICDIVLRKNYNQARRISAELIDKKVRDFENMPSFPSSASHHLNLGLDALEAACIKCEDIPIQDPSYSPPVPSHIDSKTQAYDSTWDVLSQMEKLALIKKVIQEDIQPYIELDAGGIEVISFSKDREIKIAYQGACVGCPSATGATLSAIQEILRRRLHPNLVVKPDLSFLS